MKKLKTFPQTMDAIDEFIDKVQILVRMEIGDVDLGEIYTLREHISQFLASSYMYNEHIAKYYEHIELLHAYEAGYRRTK